MNGYSLLAASYRKYAETEPDEVERGQILRKVKALDFLAETDRETHLELFNSGAFNDVVKGFCEMALNNAGVDPDQRADVLTELRGALDTTSAEEAERYHIEH